MPAFRSLIGRHLDRSIQSWPMWLAKEFNRYCISTSRIRRSKVNHTIPKNQEPYWLVMAQSLAKAYWRNGGPPPFDRRFVNDILWGQYCLFLSIKIHDDVFDQHTDRLSLVFVGDEFLLEAQRIFLLYFPLLSPFWKFFYRSLRKTLHAIVAVDQFQLHASFRKERIFRWYVGEYSLCKIGLYAISLKAGRREDFRRAEVFADEMAIVGQIMDDFLDMEEDFERRRFNYVASFFLNYRNNGKSLRRRPLRHIVANLLLTDGTSKLFSEIRKHVKQAEDAIAPLGLPQAKKYLRAYQQSLDNMENQVHQQRVKVIFGSRARLKSQ